MCHRMFQANDLKFREVNVRPGLHIKYYGSIDISKRKQLQLFVAFVKTLPQNVVHFLLL